MNTNLNPDPNQNPKNKRSQLRCVNGVLLLDKPINMTSNDVLQKVKRLFAARKAGHTGSLDPLATGMLPICFGEATKFSQFLLDADKRYWVVAQLGARTTTGDAEGEIVERQALKNMTSQRVAEILENFRGEISQVPSMFSALKYKGRPLYELARKGITVERQARTVRIHDLKWIAQTEDTLTLEINCSKGTYIRTLIEDIGTALGCGAYVKMLRRLSVNGYRTEQMVTLETLTTLAQENNYAVLDFYLINISSMMPHWPVINISEAAFYYLKRGQSIIVPHAISSGFVRLEIAAKRFLGIGEILQDGRIAPRRLVQEGL